MSLLAGVSAGDPSPGINWWLAQFSHLRRDTHRRFVARHIEERRIKNGYVIFQKMTALHIDLLTVIFGPCYGF